MALSDVLPGDNVPHEVNVIIEIPAYSDPVKYEIDKKSNMLFVDRFMGTAMQYPCNYGYIPYTLSLDHDPLDVIVFAPWRLVPRCVVRCRPIGLLKMRDESGLDRKIMAVPVEQLTPLYRDVHSFRDIPSPQLDQIVHFFEHYKDLEPGKWTVVEGWGDPDEAKEEIMASVRRYEREFGVSVLRSTAP